MSSIRTSGHWPGVLWGAVFLLWTWGAGAQQHLVDEGGIVSECGFYFLDDGGALQDAATGGDHTTTFCPDSAGGELTFSFSICVLAPGDTLFLWRSDSAAGVPDGSYSGTDLVGLDIGNGVGPDNPAGCLTWRFVTGPSGGSNFAALVSCSAPCLRPVVSAAAFLGGQSQPAVVEACLEAEIEFDAGGTVLPAGVGAASWNWDFGDGAGDDLGPNPIHAFAEPGVYPVQLTVTDSAGCSSVNSIDLTVHVAAPIAIDVPSVGPHVCAGGTAVLGLGAGGVTTSPVASQPNASFGAGIVIPDSVGQSFTSAITFSGFPFGQSVADTSDILGVTLNLEHSFILDLVVELECPNGSTMVLQGWPGGAGGCVNAGEPVTGDDPPLPGVGYDYTWSPGVTTDWQTAAMGLLPTPTSGCAFTTPPLPAAAYAATGDWTALEGCPINGTWTLSLMDTQAGDNGFLFGWSLDLAGDITPEQTVFEATVGTGCDSAFWTPAGNWDFPAFPVGDCAALAVEPNEPGTYGYIFTAVDAFGCTADTTVFITVEPGLDFALSSDLLDPLGGVDASVCEDGPFVLQAHALSTIPLGTQYNWVVNGVSTGQAATLYVDPDPVVGAVEVMFQASVAAPPPIPGVCQFEWSDTIEVVPLPTLSLEIASTCSNTPIDLAIGATADDPSWQWTLVLDELDTVSSVTWDNPNLSLLPEGGYQLYGALTDIHGCGAEDTTAFTVHPAPNPGFSLEPVCAGEPLPFTLDDPVDYASPNTVSSWALMGGGELSDEGGHLGTTASGGGGFPQIILTMVSDNPDGSTCTASASQFAMIHSLPFVGVVGPDAVCDAADATWLAAATIPFPGQVVSTEWAVSGPWNLSGDGLLPLVMASPPVGNYTVGYTAISDQGCVAEHLLDFEVQPIPNAGFTLPAEVCQGSPVALDLSSPDSSGHSWTANGAALDVVGALYPEDLSALPGTVTVQHIATWGICSDTASAVLEVAPLPEAAVSGPTAACEGDPVLWLDASTNPTSDPLALQWAPTPGSPWPAGGGAVYDVGMPAPGTYGMTLVATSSAGCADSAAWELFVGTTPDAGFQVEGVCAGQPIPLAVDDTASLAAAEVQWLWNGAPLAVSNTTALPDSVSSAAGMQLLDLTLSMVHPEITCTAQHSATVAVHAQPEAGFSAPADFCAGPDAAFLDATAIDYGAEFDLAWTLDAGSGPVAAGNGPGLLLAAPAPGTYTISLTASTPVGCTSTATDTLAVFDAPDAGFTLPDLVCQGSAVPVATAGMAGSGTWTANGDAMTLEGGTFPAALTGIPGMVTVVHAVVLGNCSDTASATLEVAPLPEAGISGPTAACEGTAVQWLDASANPTSDPLSLEWAPAPGTPLDPFSGATWDFGQPEPGVYGLTLSVTTSSGCSDSTAATLFIGTAPDAGFQIEDVCAGQPIPLILDDPVGYGAADAQWVWNGAPLAMPTTASLPGAVSAAPGLQSLALTLSLTHPQIVCTAAEAATIAVHAQPEAAISAPSDFCAGPDATFTDATAIAADVPFDLQWTLDEGSGPVPYGGDAALFLPSPVPGNYVVTLTATTGAGCSASTADTLAVLYAPDAAFSLPDVACQNSAVPVVTSGTDGGMWTANGVPLNTADGTYAEPLTMTPGTVTVVHTVDLGNCSDMASATLEVAPLPEAVISGPQAACEGDGVQWLDASVNPTSAALSLQWTSVSGTDLPPYSGPMMDFGAPEPGTYGVNLTVTTAAGCSDSTAGELFVGTTPDAGFQLGEVCAGQPMPLTLDAPFEYAAAQADWLWNGNPLEVPAVDVMPEVVSAAAGVQELTLFLAEQHPQITCLAEQTAAVAVHAQPVAALVAPADFCAGPDAVFTDATAIDPGVALDLEWTLDDGIGAFAPDPGAELLLEAPNPGTYAVTLTATTAAGCVSTAADTLAVYAAPDASFSLPAVVCEGSTLSVPAVGTPGVLAWTLDGLPIATADGAFDAAATAGWGSRNVGVTVTLGSGASQCADVHVQELMVEALPEMGFTGASAACTGESVQWVEACSHPQGLPLSTAWSPAGGQSVVGASMEWGLQPAGQYAITLTATSPSGCAADLTDQITFEASPEPAFTLTEACSGNPVFWTPEGPGFFGTPSWAWAGDAITVQGDTVSDVVSAMPGEQTLVLTLAEAYPSGVTCSAVDSATTTVHPTPTAGIAGPADLCAGDTASFSGSGWTAIPADLTYSWSWTGSGNETASGGELTLPALPVGTVEVQLVVTATGGCTATASAPMEVVAVPEAAFALPSSACAGAPVTIAWGAGGSGALDSTWTLDGAPLLWAEPGIPAALTAVPGNHEVMLSLSLTSGTVTCTAEAMEAIEVHAVPEASWDVVPEACSGIMLGFEAEAQIVTGVPLTTAWSVIGEDTLMASGGSLSLGTPAPGQYTVQFDVVGSGGCAAALEQVLTIHPSPEAAFTAGDVCVGEPIPVAGYLDAVDALDAVVWTWNGNPTSVAGGWMDPLVSSYAGPQMLGATVTTTFDSGFTCSDSHMTTAEVWPAPEAQWSTPEGLCAGEEAVFLGYSTVAGGGTLTTAWSWNAGGTELQSMEGDEVFPGVLPAGAYSVSMVVETEWGCLDSLGGMFLVHPLPVADFSLEDVCAGTPALWSAEQADGWVGTAAWSWNGEALDVEDPEQGAGPGGFLPEVVVADSGVQWIGVVLEEVFPDGTVCVAAAMEPLQVHPQPAVSWDVEPGWCAGSAATFAASAGVEGADLDWTLSGPQGLEGYGGTVADLGLLPAGTYTLQLVASTPEGCADSLSAAVKVHPNPTVQFTLEPVCAGGAIPVSWSGADSVQTEWTWNGDPIEVAGATLPPAVSAAPGQQWIQLEASQEFPTGATCSAAALNSVEVFPLPVAEVAPDTLWCAGEQAIVNATPTGEGALSCTWSTPMGFLTGPTWALPEDAIGLIPATLTVTSGGGCSDTRDFTVRIDPLPQVTLTDSLLMGCAPFEAELQAVTSGYNGVVLSTAWSWPGGAAEGTAWSEELGVASWPISCTVTTGDTDLMCSGTAHATAVGLEVPQAEFSMFPASPTVQQREVEFTAEGGGPASGFTWTVNGATTSAQPVWTYAFAPYFGDTYTVCLEAVTAFGCADETCREVEVIGEVQVYVPSGFTPDNDGINDLFKPSVAPIDQVEDYRLEIYNRWGALVFHSEDPMEGWNGSYPGGTHFAGNEVFNWVIVIDTELALPQRMMGQVSVLR